MIKTHSRVDGNGKRWVTFITGIANDLSMWDGQVPALERDFRILRYDLRGHGGSETTPGDYSIDTLVEDLRTLLESRGIEKTSLVGLGLGGAIAQAFAIQHPGRVERLHAGRVPHMGWNELRVTAPSRLLERLDGEDVYFAHSYACAPEAAIAVAEVDHDGPVVAAVEHGAVAGVQFHPERSGPAGARALRNALAWSRSV